MISTIPNRSLGGAIIAEPNDQNIKIPNSLNATVEFPSKLSTILNSSGFGGTFAPLQENSHIYSFVRTQPASSALAVFNMSTFKAGLWRIVLRASVLKTFLPATSVDQVMLTDPASSTTVCLVDLTAEANVVKFNGIEFLVSFPVDLYTIEFQQGATGVGQSIFFTAQLVANRLA